MVPQSMVFKTHQASYTSENNENNPKPLTTHLYKIALFLKKTNQIPGVKEFTWVLNDSPQWIHNRSSGVEESGRYAPMKCPLGIEPEFASMWAENNQDNRK